MPQRSIHREGIGADARLESLGQDDLIDFAGNLDFCIAIRTVIMSRGTAYIQAGAGLVMDSNPAAEYEETRDKARALVRALELAQQGL